MRIKEFRFEDKGRGWKLENLQLGKLTLLVGASGAGKTQILRALLRLKSVANGNSALSIQWFVKFDIQGKEYEWEGEFGDFGNIVFEKIVINKNTVINRTETETYFNGNKTLKFSNNSSIVNVFGEDEILPIKQFKTIFSFNDFASFSFDREGLLQNIWIKNLDGRLRSTDIEFIQKANHLGIIEKLYLVFEYNRSIFNKIIDIFKNIFPQIEDVKFQKTGIDNDNLQTLFFKDKETRQYYFGENLASGMQRVLLQLVELELCPDGTIFLIDELENSLGINCINELTKEIVASQRDLQFIITSHHPYIINNIPFEHWKIVTRKGNAISTHDASEYNLGRSKHDRFMQLLQLEEYQTGITL